MKKIQTLDKLIVSCSLSLLHSN